MASLTRTLPTQPITFSCGQVQLSTQHGCRRLSVLRRFFCSSAGLADLFFALSLVEASSATLRLGTLGLIAVLSAVRPGVRIRAAFPQSSRLLTPSLSRSKHGTNASD